MRIDHITYLAGPMTGKPAYNWQTFMDAAKYLRESSFNANVVTPFAASNIVWQRHFGRDFYPMTDVCEYGSTLMREMLAEDFKILSMADNIVLLNDWRTSSGARVEYLCAVMMLKIPAYELWQDMSGITGPLELVNLDIQIRARQAA